nr:hypothetical protein GCM10017611_88000 [Rhodococcus wratislaviensis]
MHGLGDDTALTRQGDGHALVAAVVDRVDPQSASPSSARRTATGSDIRRITNHGAFGLPSEIEHPPGAGFEVAEREHQGAVASPNRAVASNRESLRTPRRRRPDRGARYRLGSLQRTVDGSSPNSVRT